MKEMNHNASIVNKSYLFSVLEHTSPGLTVMTCGIKFVPTEVPADSPIKRYIHKEFCY